MNNYIYTSAMEICRNLHGTDMMTPTQVQMKKAAKEGLLKDIPLKLITDRTNNNDEWGEI